MAVAVGIEEEGGIGNYSKLAIGLRADVVAPKQGCDSSVERSHEDYFLPIFEPVDLVEVGNGGENVLASLEVQFLVLVFDGVAIT